MIACLSGKYADFLIESPAVFRLVITCFVLIGESIPFGNIYFDGRVEIDFQYILAGFQMGLDDDPPFAEHIVGFQYLLLVQIHISIRIQSLENELDVLPLHHLRGEVEGSLVHPVLLVNPLHAAFVEAEERIFNNFVVHQVGMYHTGHGGRIPVVESGLFKLPTLVQLPSQGGGYQEGTAQER